MSRRSALSPTELLRLDQWAAPLAAMFPFGFGPYLVGSAMTRKTYRDVDVRQPVGADDALVGDPDRLRLVNVAMSVWAQQSTGLPIDFQFQSMTEFHEHDGKPRNPLGKRWSRATPPPAADVQPAVDNPIEPTVDHIALRHVAAGGVLR